MFGSDVLLGDTGLLENKKIGVVTNHTAVLKNGVHLIDTLLSLGLNVTALFAPEHGFEGRVERGELIENSKHQLRNIPIYSLHGKIKKPTEEMLANVEIILFDIQDIGTRFYTYISTLYYVLLTAAENNIAVYVLDRPNPIGGEKIEGPVLEENFKSFIGIAPIPIRHGMTIGELANMFVSENMINTIRKAELKVFKMAGWERTSYWKDLNISWLPTSPNIPDPGTALIYPGTCMLEGTNISEGRGTEKPFLTIGAPFVDSKELIEELNFLGINGVEISATSFTPVSLPGKALKPKYEDELCYGISISINNYSEFEPVGFGIKLIYSLINLYPDKFEFINEQFDLLTGTDQIRLWLEKGKNPEFIIASWEENLEAFNKIRTKYLFY